MSIEVNKNPLVTIGVPNYNYAHYIVAALESVVSQTYPNIELLVVDDCSTDSSVEIINEWIYNYKGNVIVKFIENQANLGLSGTCNVILNNASGVYYQTLDADDLITADKVTLQIEVLIANPDVAIIYSNAWIIDEDGLVKEKNYLSRIGYKSELMPEGNIFDQLFNANFIPLPTVLINTSMARKVGGYENKYQVQDYFLWFKLAKDYPVLFQPLKLAYYRVHSNSMSNNPKSNLKSIDSVLRIKFQYFDEVQKPIKKIIKKNIHFATPMFYRYKDSNAEYWLKKDLVLNPGLKSLGYFISYKIGIPYSFFAAFKKKDSKI